MHKQFNIDRAAAHLGVAWLTKAEAGRNGNAMLQQVSPNFEWRFQNFKATNKKNGSVAKSPFMGAVDKKNSIRWLFSQLPAKRGGAEESAVIAGSFGGSEVVASRADLFSAGDILKKLIALGFDGASENIVEEVVDDEW
ncbi:hypothetical protein Maes01_01495 [Microbulbifer aestuariivivens]|uniref:Uncharacterized protein n=1 Tax=Microbulbifer aestuariivivens TaxID=1908308 RepID=A0ABP9WS22_9GAMM